MKMPFKMRYGLGAGAVAVALLTLPSLAVAGMCPANKLGSDVTKPGPTASKGVKDIVLAMIDLAKEPANVDGRLLRIRRLEIEPGGIVAWHSHGDRPALIYMVRGQMVEHASNCAVPIIHKEGDVARETHVTSHWWKNETEEVAVLTSSDLPRNPNAKGM